MPLPFDAALKEIIAQHPRDFAAVFDLPRTTPISALNVDLSTLTAATDVAFGFGKPLTEIVDLNFQSGPDRRLPSRLHLYSAALHHRYGVPVRSILVLLRPKADASHLTGKLVYGKEENPVQFPYEVVRLWQHPVEPFLRGGVGLLPLAPLCQLPEPLPASLWQVVRAIDHRLAQEADHAQAVRLMTAAFILTGMRVAKEELTSIYSGVRLMQESTAFDMAVEEGMEKGLAEGLEKGLEQGLAEGRLEEGVRLLLKQGRKRFGSPDPRFEAELTAIHDLDRLERMAEGILTVSSWQELLATP